MKKLFFMLPAMLLATQVAFAQQGAPQHPQPNPELHKAMQAYIEKNVQPVLLKAQKDFDAKLSAEDLSFIKEKRAQATEKKEQMKANHQKAMELKKEGKSKEEIHEVLGINREDWMEAGKAQREAMKAFMDRNQETVKSSMEALKPSYKTWIEEEKAIIDKYMPENKAPENGDEAAMKKHHGPGIGLFGIAPPRPFGDFKKGGDKKMHPDGKKWDNNKKRPEGKKGDHTNEGQGQKSKEGMHRGQHNNGRLAMEFVLWDGKLPAALEVNGDFQPLKTDNARDIFSLQNYPNPANGITKISAELPKEVKLVKITLRDASGKTVKDLSFKNATKGANQFDIDVSSLPEGLYFYTFDADGQKTTKRMVVGK
ncbi:MAG: T9SS type A sorting domain-containing protein [Saprospiraceae bacterium]|nr:T9SS type A sorting domain-containing protein [Saprospiraceae bacterium]MCB9323403.1 T9SS type A sorting domain-containing protein [Lewinellaceae bacterium]